MRAYLFRRVLVDGVNYYQLYKVDNNFENKESLYKSFNQRDSSDYFYLDASFVDKNDLELEEIYYSDDNNELKLLKTDQDIYEKVYMAFVNSYHTTRTLKPAKDVVSHIKKTVMFQDVCIRSLINRIYLNQSIVNSDLPTELKVIQKSNILFHGNVGSGKKTIIECLEKELPIPYVDVTLTTEPKESLEMIIKKLLESANGDEKAASNGIVFIRDNYSELYDILGENVYSVVNYITSLGPISYNGKIIDFRTLTFVVLFDRGPYVSAGDVQALQEVTNCTCSVSTKQLTIDEKYKLLLSKNGRLYHYKKFLSRYKKELIIDDRCLRELIEQCSEIDPSMGIINATIDSLVKLSLIGGVNDVIIDEEALMLLAPVLGDYKSSKRQSTRRNTRDTKYKFEKMVDDLVAKTKKYVVGQDRAVKLIARQLVNNLCWANKEDVEKPKDYIKNILIRGNTGTGKTFIPETMLRYLDVPYYVANATDYTEAGYVGKDVEDMLVALYHAAGDDLEKAERGILVIDEFDKRASKVGDGSRDVGGSGVQEALYKFAEGTKIRINVGNRLNEEFVFFDTSRLTIIFSGAFEGIEKIRDERLGKRKAGFGEHDNTKYKDTSITDDDYVTYGMKRQFMRRIKGVIELNDVTKEQLVDIMKQSESSALKTERETLKEQGIELEYSEGFYDALAEKAFAMKQGVTGIEKALEKVLQNIRIEDIRASETKKIILNEDVISDPSKLVLIPRAKQKVKKI